MGYEERWPRAATPCGIVDASDDEGANNAAKSEPPVSGRALAKRKRKEDGAETAESSKKNRAMPLPIIGAGNVGLAEARDGLKRATAMLARGCVETEHVENVALLWLMALNQIELSVQQLANSKLGLAVAPWCKYPKPGIAGLALQLVAAWKETFVAATSHESNVESTASFPSDVACINAPPPPPQPHVADLRVVDGRRISVSSCRIKQKFVVKARVRCPGGRGCIKYRQISLKNTALFGVVEVYAYLGVWLRKHTEFGTNGDHKTFQHVNNCRITDDEVAAYVKQHFAELVVHP